MEHLVPWMYHCRVTPVFLWPFWAILGGHASDMMCLKCIILFADVTLLKGAVTSDVMSQHYMCIGHMAFYYKSSADTLVEASCLLFVHSSGLTLSPETCVWLVHNMCRSQRM